MTAKERFDQLQNAVTKSWKKLLEADKELSSIQGFGEIDSLPKYRIRYNNWQYAQSNFNSYLSWLTKNNIKPEDEIIND